MADNKEQTKAAAKDLQGKLFSSSGKDTTNDNKPEVTPEVKEPTVAAVPETEDKTKPEYLYLDVSGRKEYLSVMAKAKGVSMTKYVQALIDEDIAKHEEKIEALKQLLNDI